VLAAAVESRSPADVAGLRVGDVILSFGGQRVGAVDDLHRLLTADRIGLPSPVTVLRGSGRRQLTVVPTERK
jgi:S1-C subfamily serine protease